MLHRLWVVLNFGAAVGQPINPDAKNVAALLARVGERESCKTTPVMEP